MMEDEVVREVRSAREAFAASCGNDIRTMVATLREWALANGRDLVHLPPRPVQRPDTASKANEQPVTAAR